MVLLSGSVADGRSLDVGQLYGDTIILRDPIDHPPAPAELVLRIDDSEHRWTVDLPQGLSRNVRIVELRNRQATASGWGLTGLVRSDVSVFRCVVN